ncbi:hypothetical protein BGZ99_004732 [Dissophora globulifera]|uniref:DUF4704 domain-containing protein n=1 Tax=Dissophora globulifera TaxID=979702 RepID=A0A9P6RYN5_9FUNG|nr:hypothetical protein BGZ99_004732 [Dissophora globulifera]
MTKLLETLPLINIAPLTDIHEVPIHINNPIHPNSGNKHRRLGLQVLSKLSRVEMFVARIEATGKQDDVAAELARTVAHLEQTMSGIELESDSPSRLENTTGRVRLQRYMIRMGLAGMFPKSAEYLGIDPILPGGSFLEGRFLSHLRHMSSINQLVSLALQLQNDLRLANHKFIAHQVALLYQYRGLDVDINGHCNNIFYIHQQCINQAGIVYERFQARIEEHFTQVKEVCNTSDVTILPPELQTWLRDLTTDIVAEALFSGRPMSQQTPDAAHLSAYINRVSSGSSLGEQPAEASSDVQTVAQKLNAFLDTFDEAYREMIPQAELEQTEMSIERLYGDCSEEDKYRREVTESPDFISRLLTLLEKPTSPETKILLLRIIATMGESDRNKIEIEGYKKILRLLITENPELTQEVVRTVNHLLEFSGDHPEIADLALVAPTLKLSTSTPSMLMQAKAGTIMGINPRSLLSRSSMQLIRPQEQDSSLPPRPQSVIMDRRLSRGTSPFDPPRRPNSSASLRNLTSIDRVSHAISEVRGIFVQELGKIFPQLKDQDGLGILGMGSDDIRDADTEKHYIPNAEQIQFTTAYYSQLIGQGGISTEASEAQNAPQPSNSAEPTRPPQQHQVENLSVPADKYSGRQLSGSLSIDRINFLKRMASTPDLRVAVKPPLGTRRNSEDRTSSEALKATQGAAVELAQEEEFLRKSHPDNVLKEFMRTQGALRSLMKILSDRSSTQQRLSSSRGGSKHPLHTGTRLATKIDIMETICKVLFQNSANQSEFKTMDGYSTLLGVFDEIIVPGGNTSKQGDQDSMSQAQSTVSGDLLVSHDHQRGSSGDVDNASFAELRRPVAATFQTSKRSLLLGSLLAVFFDLALDGSTRDMVQNMDAYHFLFRLLLESKQLDVRQHALYAIQDLITLNPLNAVAAWRCGQIDMVIGQLRKYLCFRPTSGTLRDTQWELAREMGLDPESPNVRNAVFGNVSYFDNFVISEDTAALADMIEEGSPVYQYAIGLTRLLEYMAVMLIQDNVYILYELSRLIMEIDFPDDSSIMINIVLRCVGRILSDMIARDIPVGEKFLSIYLQVVRRMLETQNRRHESIGEVDDEQEQELRDCVHTEQRLLGLHILGLVLKGIGNSVDVFELLQGFETLTNTILLDKRSCHHSRHAHEKPATYAESLREPGLCQDCYRSDIVVSDLALWLFRELALQDADNGSTITWVVVMLKSTLSGIEELRRQSEAAKASSRNSRGFLQVTPEQQQDQAHALLAYLYTKICSTVSLIFRESSDAKPAFGEASGMQILLSVLSSAQHPEIATAALVAIGDFFAGYEGTKALLGDSFGYDGFLEIVLDSCRPLDNPRKVGERNSFRLPDTSSIHSKGDRHGGSPAYQTNGRGTPSRPSSVYLEETLDVPSPGFSSAQTQLHTGPPVLSSGSSANSGVTAASHGNRYSIFGMSPWSNSTAPSISVSFAQESIPALAPSMGETGESTSSLSRGSLHTQRSGRSTPAPPSLDINVLDDTVPGMATNSTLHQALQVPKESKGGVVANRKRSNSRNLGGFGLNTTNLGLQSVVPSERLAFKQLAGIVFRDSDAARMTLRLLGRIIDCNNPKLATDYFNLLMLLMEVTPRNKELLSQNDGLRFMLEILFRRGRQHDGLGLGSPGYPFLPRTTDPPYVDLVPAMGAYDISVEDVRLLFDAVYDPLDMFFRLTAEPKQTMPALASTIKDSLGPLPELPAKFDREPSSRRNSAGRPRSESASAVTPYTGRRSTPRYIGATSGAFNSLPFNPLFIGEMEQQMMYAIEKISERVDPPAYFNFNGLNASLTTYPGIVEKAVSAKGGYTVSVWVKVTAFLEKETGLFCYEEENGNRTIFELYFKSLDQSNRYCLCVRTQHYPSPPEDFVFDRFDFAETGIWHHIVFVHHKTMKLMVDGCIIQSYGTFNQRRQEKEGGMIGVLGRKGRNGLSGMMSNTPAVNDGTPSTTTSYSLAGQDNLHPFSASTLSLPSYNQNPVHGYGAPAQEPSLGHFCGQAGKVHFLQGEWDQATAEKVYNLGPASTESWKSYDIRSPVIAVLDPEDFLRDLESTAGGTTSDSPQDQSAPENLKIVLTHGILQGGCTVHMTRAMRNLISQVGGIQLCFRFLEMSPSHLQLVGLRVISNLLYKSTENIAQFQNELDGYEIMYELLSNTASELSVDHFGVLFDIAINGMIKDEHLILSNMPCVHLILRLLPSTLDSVQSYILRTLVDLIVESPENMRFWRASFGMTTLFELVRTLPAHLRPFLMWTLESMMDGMTVQELGLLIGFIGHEDPELFEVRRDIIEMLFKRMTADHSLVDLLGSGLEGVTVMIGLLDSPNEHFRILVLKMIGILLSDNTKSGKAALSKPNIGIGLIRSTLEKYPLSMEVIQVLLGLAQNSYRCDIRSIEKSAVGSTRKSAEKTTISPQHSSFAVTPVLPSPLKDSPLPPTPTELFNNHSISPHDATSQHGARTSLEDQAATKLDVSPSLQGPPVPRKHVHSNSANAPFIKMSSLPTEPLVISSAASNTAGTVDASNALQASKGGAKITDELTYASMIQLILELTGSLPHTDLVTHTLTDLKRLMTLENMRILWEAGWVGWVAAFMQDKTKVRVTSAAENLSYNRAMGVLDGMMQKMMIFDLSRKGSVIVRNKGALVGRDEDVGVQLRLTEAALAWFDKNPNLDTDAANVICKGLVILFRRLEELSRKFEDRQRRADKARQDTLERERALQVQRRAQEQERERLALEAVSSALSGVLDSLVDSSHSDESDSKSLLLKADEGDTDAEEVSGEFTSSNPMDASMGGAAASFSGSASPNSSSTSTLSLPLSTLSASATQPSLGQSTTRDSFEPQVMWRSPSSPSNSSNSNHNVSNAQHQQQHRHHHNHQQGQSQNRRHRSVQTRSINHGVSNSSTPPAIPDPTGTVILHSHDADLGVGAGGIFWPPLGLYEHFASCVNNLACFNNSAIRSAMKSSGLFKIRDSLIEKLSKLEHISTGVGVGAGALVSNSSTIYPYGMSGSPLLGSSGFLQNQLNHRSMSSSSSSLHIDSESNTALNMNGNGSNGNISGDGFATMTSSAHNNINHSSAITGHNHGSKGGNGRSARNRQNQRQHPTGLGLGLSSIV